MQDLRSPERHEANDCRLRLPLGSQVLDPEFGPSARRPEISRTEPSPCKVRPQLRKARSSVRVTIGASRHRAQRRAVSLLYRRRASTSGFFMPITRRLKDDHVQSRVGSSSYAAASPPSSTSFLSHGQPGRRLMPYGSFEREHRAVAVVHRAPGLALQPTTPNPSFEARPNGKPPGPAWRYAVHFRQPGPGVLPLVPPQLER